MSQLQIEASCQPVPDRDGLQTIACAGTLMNPGPDILYVVAIAVVPGETSAEVEEYELPPGSVVHLPTPPVGGVWVIGAETRATADHRGDLALAGAVAVGALAGLGAADLLIGLYRLARRR